MANVLKSGGGYQGFDINKVIQSIEKPLQESGIYDPMYALEKAMFIQDVVYSRGEITSSEIADMVIKALMNFGNVNAVKSFILKGVL